MPDIAAIRTHLLAWYRTHHRRLPWRETSDPYAILVSEVMLQQTRVATALPFYERFLLRFPTLESLTAAPEKDVLALWAGLGYYYRARNLQKAARAMAEAGGFPADYASLRALPGVGDYTAAAVASIAFGLPHAVLDGNVMRVVSRLWNDAGDIGSTGTRRSFQVLATELLDREHPGEFNQAVMELGATICVPREPKCLLCPVNAWCEARQAGTQNELPVNAKKVDLVQEVRTLLVIRRKGKLLFRQRPEDARLMPGFYELPEESKLPNAQPIRSLGSVRHGQTKYLYTFHLVEATLKRVPPGFVWLGPEDWSALPVSTVAKKALAQVFG